MLRSFKTIWFLFYKTRSVYATARVVPIILWLTLLLFKFKQQTIYLSLLHHALKTAYEVVYANRNNFGHLRVIQITLVLLGSTVMFELSKIHLEIYRDKIHVTPF